MNFVNKRNPEVVVGEGRVHEDKEKTEEHHEPLERMYKGHRMHLGDVEVVANTKHISKKASKKNLEMIASQELRVEEI